MYSFSKNDGWFSEENSKRDEWLILPGRKYNLIHNKYTVHDRQVVDLIGQDSERLGIANDFHDRAKKGKTLSTLNKSLQTNQGSF